MTFGPRDQPSRGPRRKVLLIDSDLPLPRRHLARVGIGAAIVIAAVIVWVGRGTPADEGSMLQPLAPPQASAVQLPAVPPPAPPKRLASAPPRPAPSAFLSVSARPWAVLSVDGRVIGNTPQIRVRLPAGVHQFRLARDGFEPYEAQVALRAGETIRLTNITLSAITP